MSIIPVLDKNNPDLRYKDIPDTPWVELKKDSRAYFFNYDIKKAVWEEPPEYTSWKDGQVDIFLHNSTDWTKKRRGADVYYLNGKTKETSLGKPQVCIHMCVGICVRHFLLFYLYDPPLFLIHAYMYMQIVRDYEAYLTDLVRVRLSRRLTNNTQGDEDDKTAGEYESAAADNNTDTRAGEAVSSSPLSSNNLSKHRYQQEFKYKSRFSPNKNAGGGNSNSVIGSDERDEGDDEQGQGGYGEEDGDNVNDPLLEGHAAVNTSRFNPNSPSIMSPQGNSRDIVKAEDVHVITDGDNNQGDNPTKDKDATTAKVDLGPKLNQTQLFDLYQRLDVNGDGELDMQEFIEVGMNAQVHCSYTYMYVYNIYPYVYHVIYR